MQPSSRIAIISNSQTPYRLHVHQRIVQEMPDVELWSVFTHEFSNAPWRILPPPELRPVYMGQGQPSDTQSNWKNQYLEWQKGKQILEWLKQSEIRFVVLEGYNDAGRLRVLRGCKRLNIPCFVFGDSNILGDNVSGAKRLVKRAVVGWVVKQAAGMLYCGRLGRLFFERYGASASRMFPFPYEPDYSKFENVDTALVQEVIRRYGLQRDRRYLIFSGRFVPPKRVDLLLAAFTDIAPLRPAWDLILIGDGPLRSPLLAALSPAVQKRVINTGFIQNPAEIAALYQVGHALVLPSDFEPWGVVVTEAAMASLALICSSVTGAGVELISDGVNGRLFPAGSSNGLRDAMLDVTEPRNLDRMRGASRSILEDWRRSSDPVQGLRDSLRFAGVMD